MSSSLAQGILVTIIGGAVLQDRLIHLLTKLDVSGYTIYRPRELEAMVSGWAT
jgi:hypothetical protein